MNETHASPPGAARTVEQRRDARSTDSSRHVTVESAQASGVQGRHHTRGKTPLAHTAQPQMHRVSSRKVRTQGWARGAGVRMKMAAAYAISSP